MASPSGRSLTRLKCAGFRDDDILVGDGSRHLLKYGDTNPSARRDGRVAEGARLESVYTLTGIGGSNPSLSARLFFLLPQTYKAALSLDGDSVGPALG